MFNSQTLDFVVVDQAVGVDAGAEVGQAQLAPLADCVAVAVGQGAVVWPCDVLGVAIQCYGVVRRYLGAETDGAFSEARLVVEDGALYPVDPARRFFAGTVVVVSEAVIATLEFVGVPVARAFVPASRTETPARFPGRWRASVWAVSGRGRQKPLRAAASARFRCLTWMTCASATATASCTP